MSIKVVVKDRNDRPAARVSVRVLWKSDGTSSGNTDPNGVFDTEANSSSTVREFYVDGSLRPEFHGDRVDSNHVFRVKINRSVG